MIYNFKEVSIKNFSNSEDEQVYEKEIDQYLLVYSVSVGTFRVCAWKPSVNFELVDKLSSY